MLAGAAADGPLGALDARIVGQGANLAVIEVKSTGELLFRGLVDGVWLASPVQIFLDLLRGEGRAREMAKPATLDGYTDRYTADCERVLVTLLRGLGPWKESVSWLAA